MKTWWICIFLTVLCYACSGDEDILPIDQLYSEELVDEFSIFDPCDTIKAPNYIVTRAAQGESSIGRLFDLKTPVGEYLFLGRSSADNSDFNKRKLFYHGMTIVDHQLSDPIFILAEDRTGIAGFDNIILLSQQSTYSTKYLFAATSNALAAATFSAGDLFKVMLYEIVENDGGLLIQNSFRLNAKSGNGISAIYDYADRQAPSPESQEFKQIEELIAQLKSGVFPFDEMLQSEKFDLQLALHQRDFRFANGLLDSELIDKLSLENQQIIHSLDRMLNTKVITSLFCLTDDQKWTVEDNVGNHIPSPFD